jgi:hypothetical protein
LHSAGAYAQTHLVSLSVTMRSGGSSSRRAPIGLVASLALILSLAFTAAPALAAPPTMSTPVVSDVSYTTAHVSTELDPQGGFASYVVQISTNGTDWTNNAGGFLSQTKGTVNPELTGLEDGTQYFVRVAASSGFGVPDPPETISPGPNPSFTTLTADPPTIPGAVAASDVFSTSATGTAEVNRPASSDRVECRFEYVSDADFTASGFAGATSRDCIPNPIEDAGAKAVTAPLGCTSPVAEAGNCLTPNTTYHLRLAAENAGGEVTKDATSTFTTLAPVAKPTAIAADDAFEVGKRSAQATGKVERPAGADPALDVSCRFEVVTDAQFDDTGFEGAARTDCVPNPITSPDLGHPAVIAEVEAQLGGLEPNTTYHLRLAAENGGGTDTKDAASTFTTLPVIRPMLTVASVTEVGYATAHISGLADPGTQGVGWGLEWAIDPDTEGWSGGGAREPQEGQSGGVDAGAPATPIDAVIPNGLRPGTTYKVRFSGFDFEEFVDFLSPEPYEEFTTKGTSTPPSADLDPVTAITGTTAHFSGTVDAHAPAETLNAEGKEAYKTDWHFECTPECPGLPSGTVEGEEGSQSIDFDAHHLDTNTSYEVKLIAHNALATVESAQTFETPLVPPTVKTIPGASDGEGGYTLAGVVNPNHSEITSCNFEWGPNSADYAFTAPCSPAPGGGGQPVTVEAHLTGLNAGVAYHANLVIESTAFGKAQSGDQSFIPTLAPKGPACPNEVERKENNSLALTECRAYEMVTHPRKEGNFATRVSFSDGDAVRYTSRATNLANSGLSTSLFSDYVATRTPLGWETIPNLNGPSGSIYGAPEYVTSQGIGFNLPYSADLRSSIKLLGKQGSPIEIYYRAPSGRFELVGKGSPFDYNGTASSNLTDRLDVSDDLSRLVLSAPNPNNMTWWGPGIYEFVGTGNDQPRRVDSDNAGSPTCNVQGRRAAVTNALSRDGRVVHFTVEGCGAKELWARVDATTSYRTSASQCTRTALDPGGACNAPSDSHFAAAVREGARVYFTSTQQLVDADTDQTNDLYACDIPTSPQVPAGTANPCAAFDEISGAATGAGVENLLAASEDGSTIYFTATGVLANNEDALDEEAVTGDHNLYVWRADAAHPAGQTSFVGRLSSDAAFPQTTRDGRYLLLATASPLTPTDTDQARDVYRYDAASGEMTRVSARSSDSGGNRQSDATIYRPAISEDGQKVVFLTAEALSSADGNDVDDAYLWASGQVSLISTGSVGGGAVGGQDSPVIAPSGLDVYFTTAAALTPADGDAADDIYDARIGGGFSFAQESCSGEACQPPSPNPLPTPDPATAKPSVDSDTVRACPKGKVAKRNKCVKRKHKKHHKRFHKAHKSHKQAGHGREESK